MTASTLAQWEKVIFPSGRGGEEVAQGGPVSILQQVLSLVLVGGEEQKFGMVHSKVPARPPNAAIAQQQYPPALDKGLNRDCPLLEGDQGLFR
jgi:hypothetical protein